MLTSKHRRHTRPSSYSHSLMRLGQERFLLMCQFLLLPLPVFMFLPPYSTGLVLIRLFSLVNLSLCRSFSLSQFVCYRPHVSPVLLSVTEPLPDQLRHIISQERRMPGKKTSKERLHTSLKTARMLTEDHRYMKLTEPHHLRRTDKKRHVTISTSISSHVSMKYYLCEL